MKGNSRLAWKRATCFNSCDVKARNKRRSYVGETRIILSYIHMPTTMRGANITAYEFACRAASTRLLEWVSVSSAFDGGETSGGLPSPAVVITKALSCSSHSLLATRHPNAHLLGRLDHVDKRGPHFVPFARLETAIRIHPYLIHRKPVFRFDKKRSHIFDVRHAGRMNVVDARANLVRIMIRREGIQQLHLRARRLDRNDVGIHLADGIDNVVDDVFHHGIRLFRRSHRAPQIAWHLARFIEQVRAIPADAVIVRQNWLRAYEFTTDRGALALNDYARANDPFAKVGKRQVAIEVSSVIRASPESFRVAWIERAYENGQLATTERWTAILTIAVQQPRDAERLKQNPLGIYVNAINWSKELGS